MKRLLYTLIAIALSAAYAKAQYNDYDDGFTVTDNTFNPNRALDSLKSEHKDVPKGMYVWTVDSHFGDVTPQMPDTAQHLFMNTIFTTGLYGEYNTTGNLGAPRINRIATDRNFRPGFDFTESYSYFITPPSQLRFTNTLSPITNISFNTCGNRTNGEDHLKVLFATNVNKRTGLGFKFDYIYGRGYYQNQSTALFDYTMWGSYTGDHYQAHLALSFDHMKVAENGGITDDNYITHPESFNETYSSNEIPVLLTENWNRINAFHATLSHRYNIGFYRKVPMTEMEKEAKRFALKAEREKNEEVAKAKKDADSKQQNATASRSFSGRPDNARIVGDLPSDSIKEAIKRIANQDKAINDSLLAMADTLAADTSWTKEEYTPVTSFIHTLKVDNYSRTYIGYKSPENLYCNVFNVPVLRAQGDSINDETTHFKMRNLFAISLHEGLNKYVPMSLKVFIAHDLRRYTLPELNTNSRRSYIENDVSIGGQLIRSTGKRLNYDVLGEFTVAGSHVGDVTLDGNGTLNLRLSKKDSLAVSLNAFYHLTDPTFYQTTYHSKHFWWDNDFKKQMQTHIEGSLSLARTRTSLRIAYDNFQNLIYMGVNYNRDANNNITEYNAMTRQTSKNISLITVSLQQDFRVGILNWENRITYQKSSDADIMPVPDFNLWTNLYLKFRIARVLKVHFGADMRFFTEYYAPEYVPQLSQFAVQENEAVKTKVGNYPVIDVYCNFRLKQCRFFIMMSHLNAGSGNKKYFYTPHHPLNESILRFGLSWSFFN